MNLPRFVTHSQALKMTLCLVVTFSMAGTAFAQTAADVDNAARQSENIQRQQLLRQQEDVQRNLGKQRPRTVIVAPVPAISKGRGGGCRNIHRIQINSAPRMPDASKIELLDNYIGHCLGVTEIQTMLGEITAFYIKKGYATARAYLPEQDLSTGLLIVKVVEGYVGDIRMAPGAEGTASVATAFPQVKGYVLNLRDIEQGLDQINRLSSNNASMDLVPGDTVGDSDIIIKNTPTKRWHVNLTGDTYGARTTGRNQIGATMIYDNLLGLNEFYSYTRRNTVPFNDGRRQSTSNSALFSIPYGYASFLLGYSDSDYNSTLNTPGGLDLSLTGDNHAVFASLDRVIYRNQDSKLSATATITDKRTRNFVAGQRLDVSSRELSILDLATNFSTSLGGGAASIGGGYSRGLRAFGSLRDADNLPEDAPHAQFDKLSITGVYSKPFQVKEQNFLYASQLTGQYALDALYGSEQISIGGIYSVRGFYDESLANDHGLLTRNDLTLLKTVGHVAGQNVSFRPYLALDAGLTGGRIDKTPSGFLAGAAVGFSVGLGPAFFDIYAGHPLIAPNDMRDEGFNTFGRLSLNF